LTAHNANVADYNKLATAWNADKSLDLSEVVRAVAKTTVGGMTVPTGPTLDLKIDTTFDKTNFAKDSYTMGTATYT